MDAWFDTMSAAPQLPYAESLAMACFAELPLAALPAWTAWRALEWAGSEQPPEPSSGHAPAYMIEFGRVACAGPDLQRGSRMVDQFVLSKHLSDCG